MSNHDYAECQDQACDLCAAYGDGYATSLFECAVAVSHFSVTPECRCSPCVSLRYAIFTKAQATPGPTVPAPTHELCVGCDHRGMLINNVCSKCWV